MHYLNTKIGQPVGNEIRGNFTELLLLSLKIISFNVDGILLQYIFIVIGNVIKSQIIATAVPESFKYHARVTLMAMLHLLYIIE